MSYWILLILCALSVASLRGRFPCMYMCCLFSVTDNTFTGLDSIYNTLGAVWEIKTVYTSRAPEFTTTSLSHVCINFQWGPCFSSFPFSVVSVCFVCLRAHCCLYLWILHSWLFIWFYQTFLYGHLQPSRYIWSSLYQYLKYIITTNITVHFDY